jgi:hypothetical protein
VIRWPLLRPFAILWALTIGGLLIAFIDPARFSYDEAAGDGMLIVMVWTIYNVVLLLIAVLACIERPRENRPQREFAEGGELIIDDGRFAAWISELGPEQARVRGPAGLMLGAVGAVEIRGVGAVAATITQETQDGYKLRLKPAPEQRRRIIRKLHTGVAIPGTAHGNLALIVKQLARSLTMR